MNRTPCSGAPRQDSVPPERSRETHNRALRSSRNSGSTHCRSLTHAATASTPAIDAGTGALGHDGSWDRGAAPSLLREERSCPAIADGSSECSSVRTASTTRSSGAVCLLSVRRSGARPGRPSCVPLLRGPAMGRRWQLRRGQLDRATRCDGQEECDRADSGTRAPGTAPNTNGRTTSAYLRVRKRALAPLSPESRGAGAVSALVGRSRRRVHDPVRHEPVALRLRPAGPIAVGPLVRTVRPPRTIAPGGASPSRCVHGVVAITSSAVRSTPSWLPRPLGQNRQSRPGLELPVFVGTWRIRPRPLVFR